MIPRVSTIFDLIDAGDADGVRALLAADPGAAAQQDDQGLSVVMRAAYRGMTDVVLEADPPLGPFERIVVGQSDGLPAPDAWTPDGFTPLHIAAFVDNVDAARTLLDAGADPNVYATASFARVTPLGTCRFANATRVEELLRERGADPKLVEDEG
jgi:ankyrin repeat protein